MVVLCALGVSDAPLGVDKVDEKKAVLKDTVAFRLSHCELMTCLTDKSGRSMRGM